jgi:hypothetical protein
MSVSQTREEIGKKLESTRPQIVRDPYQYLLLELILDVLVDIRDSGAKDVETA